MGKNWCANRGLCSSNPAICQLKYISKIVYVKLYSFVNNCFLSNTD